MTNKIWKMPIWISPAVIVLLAIAASPRASEPKIQNQTQLKVIVTGKKPGTNHSAPIAGADVVVSSNDGNFYANPTTDWQGVAMASDVPYGKYLIQVNAPGWKTGGYSNYELNKKEQTVSVELKPAEEAAPSPSPTPSSSS